MRVGVVSMGGVDSQMKQYRHSQRSYLKLALRRYFDTDLSGVLMIYMPWSDAWELPCGHLEAGKLPDRVIGRALFEKYNLACDLPERKDFLCIEAVKSYWLTLV